MIFSSCIHTAICRLGTRSHFAVALVIALAVCSSQVGTANAQSNLVFNGSFELADEGWGWNGGGVILNNYSACDGKAWLEPIGAIWQDLATVPNRPYQVQFASKNGTTLRVRFADSSADVILNNPNVNSTTWIATNVMFTANSDSSQLRFEAISGAYRLDAVAVRWVEEPITITVPVPSRSCFEGGGVSFHVRAVGGMPLGYQWHHGDLPLPQGTNRVLMLTNLAPADSGDYWVRITNAWRSTDSLRAKLVVNPIPDTPLIVFQPKPRTAVQGYAAAFHVVAYGAPPLYYYWQKDGTNLPGSTASRILFSAVYATNAGVYSVLVSNHVGTVQSLPAALAVPSTSSAGGYLSMANKRGGEIDAPVFDTDGVKRLAGSGYVAQLYSGPTPDILTPVGAPVVFSTGFLAGYFGQVSRLIPDVPTTATAFSEIRAWDNTVGATYEEARAKGGRHGRSKMTETTVYQVPAPPKIVAMTSFSLEAGASPLAIARFEQGAPQPDGSYEWLLIGDPGYQYVVESKTPPNNWVPMLVLSNATGSVSFVDTNSPDVSPKFYRAQILEP